MVNFNSFNKADDCCICSSDSTEHGPAISKVFPLLPPIVTSPIFTSLVELLYFFDDNCKLAEKNILIGSDTPDIPAGYLNQCVELLDEYDVVFGPCRDGGYYLVAMNKPEDVFAEIDWGTELVLQQTLGRCEKFGVRYALLNELNDVDEIQDLRELLQGLESVSDSRRSDLSKALLSDLNAMRLSDG